MSTRDVSARPRRVILDVTAMRRVIDRIAHQILEKTDGARDTVLLGIPTRGTPLAERLAERIRAFAKPEAQGVEPGIRGDEPEQQHGSDALAPYGSLDITLYRDDLRHHHTPRPIGHTQLPSEGIDGKRVILVDDVLFSGRTIRAAFDALADLGRPSSVQLAVLVDRGHREFPIRADYVGKNLPTARDETVEVRLRPADDVDEVVLRP